MSVRILIEIGHEAALRNKRTPEGFTHDWEIFVRGCEGLDPSNYIEKVVFNLHETFPKPRRVCKEPPYSVKESGYAGFNLPIDIYLKNKDEPKKIRFHYDLHLQDTGPAIMKLQKEKYIFHDVSEDFKRKLLKGGATIVNSTTNSVPENEKAKDKSDDKTQLTGKPKLGGDLSKKHRKPEHRSEEPKVSSSFADLFGTVINKGSKVSPDPKKNSPNPKSSSVQKKEERSVKDKSDRPDKNKLKHSPLKEKDRDNNKLIKDNNDRLREEKRKSHSNDKCKDKGGKRAVSPKRISPPRPNSSSGRTDEFKLKVIGDAIEKKIDTKDKKAKKEKKSHDKDKDREKKEHRREKEKERLDGVFIKNITLDKADIKLNLKDKETPPKEIILKEKEKFKEKDKNVIKPFDTPNSLKTDLVEAKISDVKISNHEKKEKDGERRHKHKKKDKNKKDESRPDRDINKEKKSKIDKLLPTKAPMKEHMLNENSNTAEDLPKQSQTPTKDRISNPLNTLSQMGDISERPSSDSDDSCHSIDETKIKATIEQISLRPLSENSNSLDRIDDKPKDKFKKTKDKFKNNEEKKRKRKSKEDLITHPPLNLNLEPHSKLFKGEENDLDCKTDVDSNVELSNHSPEAMEMSPEPEADPEPKPFTPDYMSELKDLQHKIMTLQDNTELQRVVQMVVETGQFEITKKTFDFDLCTLDRSTVQRLQEFFATTCS